VRCARFSCDGSTLWSVGGRDRCVALWTRDVLHIHSTEAVFVAMNAVKSSTHVSEAAFYMDPSVRLIIEGFLPRKASTEVSNSSAEHWLKSLEPPAVSAPVLTSEQLPKSLCLDHVFGYRGLHGRDNLFLNRRAEVVYSVGSVCVVLEREQNLQRHFREHKGEVICLALHPDGVHVVSGDCAFEPRMWVWSSETGSAVSVMQGFYSTGSCIASCCFTRDGRRVVSVGSDASHSVAVWEMSSGQLLASERGSKGPIFAVACCPKDGGLVTVGQTHIKFWTLTSTTGVGLRCKKGDFGKLEASRCLLLCVEFSSDGYALTGTSDGSILVWKDAQIRHTVRAHQGPVFSLWLNSERGLLASGGKDGHIKIWNSKMKRMATYIAMTSFPVEIGDRTEDFEARALCWSGPRIIVGLGGDAIVDLVESTGEASVIVSGHKSGDVWCVAPSPVSSSAAASVGSDGWLRLWDSRSRRPSNSVNLRKGCARCVCWSPDGRMLGVGFDSGAVIVVDSLDFKEVWFVHHRTDGVLCVAFSVDGSKLATGSAASVIDLFDARSWKRLGQCEGHTGAVTHLDWSRDGRWLMSNSSELELMYWDVEGCARVPASGDARAAEWATQTCVLSWGVQGLYNAEVVAGSVLCADVFGAGEDAVIVSGDMKGVLRLSRWPCGKDSEQREFRCHGGGEVRCARFSCDSKSVWVSDGMGVLSLFVFTTRESGLLAHCPDVYVTDALISADFSASSSMKMDFVVSSTISCVSSSLQFLFFARQVSIFRVLLADSNSSEHKVDTIMSKFQPFTCLSLDPADAFLAAACRDGTILIYDVNSQIVLSELSGHGDGCCTAFQFSPNLIDAVSSSDKGQLLVSVCADVALIVL